MTDLLTNRIACDLKINRFKNETAQEFGCRLIYSSLATWARNLVLGKSYIDLNNAPDDANFDYHDVDIMHIQIRLKQIAYGLLMILPHSKDWLLDKGVESKSRELASAVIEGLLFCYELSRLNNPRRLTNSPARLADFQNKQLILGGEAWKDSVNKIMTIGFGRWIETKEVTYRYKNIFNISEYSAKGYYEALLVSAFWQKSNLAGRYRIFKIGENYFHNSAWHEFSKKKLHEGVFLLKNMEVNGGYFLVKKDKQGIFTAGLDKWYQDEKEIYRIMYAFNSFHNTPIRFRAVDYDDYIVLYCHNRLPNPEMRILLLSSWPKRWYKDEYYRIIPKFTWIAIKNIFKDLGIEIDVYNERKECL